MSNKLTYKKVKQALDDKTNGECRLISTKEDFVDRHSPLIIQCKCGNTFQAKYCNFNKLNFECKDCRDKRASARYRFNIKFVKDFINSTTCEYISGEYINTSSPLTIRCSCGNIFVKDFNHFKRGQQRCPTCGNENTRKSKIKYNFEAVKQCLSKKGYTVLDNHYIDSQTPIKCKCSKGHEFYIKFSCFLVNHSGCKDCANLNLRGENHWNYKGGESEVIDDLRKSLKTWKQEIAKKYEYKCYLTGTKKDCVIHHLYPFKKIVEDSCKELNLPLHRNFGDYTISQFNELKNLVISKHTVNIGILLQRKVHKKFHAIYGVRNTTAEQFNEFIEKYYPKKEQLNNSCEKEIKISY